MSEKGFLEQLATPTPVFDPNRKITREEFEANLEKACEGYGHKFSITDFLRSLPGLQKPFKPKK